jgi:hypothetical protein
MDAKWTLDYSDRDNGYVYKFQAKQREEVVAGKKEIVTKPGDIFHHDYAPVGTPDSWYVKVNAGNVLSGYCDRTTFFYGGSWIGPGDVYVSLRYVRYVAQIEEKNERNM